jgi:hypothetical protein
MLPLESGTVLLEAPLERTLLGPAIQHAPCNDDKFICLMYQNATVPVPLHYLVEVFSEGELIFQIPMHSLVHLGRYESLPRFR